MIPGVQSALQPYGPEAAAIAQIIWVLIGASGLIFALVVDLAALAILSPRRWLATKGLIVGGGIVFPTVVLSALLVYTLLASPRLAAQGAADVVIEVVGHQWWWEVRYLDPAGNVDFVTANHLHLPVGGIAEIRLRSADVLHSFWVPALAGKLDLIPGKDNRLRLVADRPGVFRGQCAEYCGGPHALMAMYVVAEDGDRFRTWLSDQRRPQPEPASEEAEQGRRLFLSRCANCHAVRGTPAEGRRGPDLTHFASRFSLGAGILPNNDGNVAGWIAGNQHHKPGNLMPEFREFDGEEVRAVTAWLGELK